MYNQYGNRKIIKGSCNNCTYESVNIGTKTMMVQRLGKIIYEGEYESNLSNIITEKVDTIFIYILKLRIFCLLVKVGYSFYCIDR